MDGTSLVNFEPIAVKYSLDLSVIKCVSRVRGPFIKNSWLCVMNSSSQ